MLLYAVLSAGLAMALVLLVMPKFLPYLKKLKFGQTIYDLGPQAHKAKQGTPNMGGIVTAGATVLTMLVLGIVIGIKEKWPMGMNFALWPLLFVMLGSMAIGFSDDFIKDVKKRHDGLNPKQKIIGQVFVGVAFSVYCYYFVGSDVNLPFTAKTWDLGIFYVPIMTVLVVFMTNSANLQDGVDGILSSVTLVGMGAFGLISLLMKDVLGQANAQMIAWMCFAIAGASIGFLRFNRHPAKIFMGDTGSMFIGGAMVGVAMLTKNEFLLLLICFTCIMSSVSVIIQSVYFKYTRHKTGTGKRIFKMTPIHHHFELSGMKENQIVLMYAGITLALSIVAVLAMMPLY